MINIVETAEEVNEARLIKNTRLRQEELLSINARVNYYEIWQQVLEVANKIRGQK
jgi:hypothetical protein